MKRSFLILVLLLILASCTKINYFPDSKFQEVRYVISDIQNVNRNVVTLADNSSWAMNRLVVVPNLTTAILILPEDRSNGYMLIKGVKYLLKNSLIDKDLDMDFLTKQNKGFLTSIRGINLNNGIMELFGGSHWQISGYYKDVVKNWKVGSQIIITNNLQSCVYLEDFSVAEIKSLDNKKQTNL